jgi:flagellar motor switch protein FliG
VAEQAAAVQTAGDKCGPGTRRAAAALLGLGSDVASSIFRLMSEAEVRQIAKGAKDLRQEGPQTVATALRTFVESLDRVGGEAVAGEELLRDAAARALGHDAGQRAFDGVVPAPPPDEFLGAIARADPESVAMVLLREQPQTVALVLSALGTEKAALIMEHLPDAQRSSVLRRMATVESVAPEMLKEVGEALTNELRAIAAGGIRKVDGKAVAVELLRRTAITQQGEVVGQIEKDDPTLAAELRGRLFTFEDLGSFSDRDVQTLLKEIAMDRLGLALKGASAAVKDRFLRNMSSRASQMLNDDLSAMGPVRLNVVEKAQGEITQLALDLAGKGRITIVRPADKMV